MGPIRGRRSLSSNPEVEIVGEAYKLKRQRNNHAVKKSRAKAKETTNMMTDKVTYLRKENDGLESEVDRLQEHLNHLKEIFLDQASSAKAQVTNGQLDQILEDSGELEMPDAVESLICKLNKS